MRARIHSATEEIHQLQRDNRQLTDALDKANETAQQMSALAHQFNLPDAQSAHNFKPEVRRWCHAQSDPKKHIFVGKQRHVAYDVEARCDLPS